MQESIAWYEKELKTNVFLNLKQNDCVKYNELKEFHKKFRDDSLAQFKEKAIG